MGKRGAIKKNPGGDEAAAVQKKNASRYKAPPVSHKQVQKNLIDGTEPPPNWLTEEAREVWEILLPELAKENFVKKFHLHDLALWVAQQGNTIIMGKAIKEQLDTKKSLQDIFTIEDSKGSQKTNPLIRMFTQSSHTVWEIGKSFGLDPVSYIRMREELGGLSGDQQKKLISLIDEE